MLSRIFSALNITNALSTPATSVKKRKVVLGFDYDGCADILFENTHNDSRKAFENFLDKITQNAEVEVYVASLRQDIITDEMNKNSYENGSCFDNLQKLCKQRNWVFRTRLVTDDQHNLPSGTAMKNRQYSCSYLTKIDIINCHFKDIARNHPPENGVDAKEFIEYHFFDDDANDYIFTMIENEIENMIRPYTNINPSFHRFHWCSDIFQEHYLKKHIKQLDITQPQQSTSLVASAQTPLASFVLLNTLRHSSSAPLLPRAAFVALNTQDSVESKTTLSCS